MNDNFDLKYWQCYPCLRLFHLVLKNDFFFKKDSKSISSIVICISIIITIIQYFFHVCIAQVSTFLKNHCEDIETITNTFPYV